MRLKLLRNAFVYQASAEHPLLPDSQQALTELVEQRQFVPVLPSHIASTGFVAHPSTGELVTPFAGGFAFVLRMDSKILPASAINAKAQEKVAEIEARENRKVYRKERLLIKDDVLALMIPQAFIKSRLVEVFYMPTTGRLILSCASQSVADETVMHVSRLYSKDDRHPNFLPIGYPHFERLSAALQRVVERGGSAALVAGGSGGNDSTVFWFDNFVQLGFDDEKYIFRGDVIGTLSEGLLEALNNGQRVERIGMRADGFAFRIGATGQFKTVRYDDVDVPEDLADDSAGWWRHEASVRCLSLLRAVNLLTGAIGDAPAEEE